MRILMLGLDAAGKTSILLEFLSIMVFINQIILFNDVTSQTNVRAMSVDDDGATHCSNYGARFLSEWAFNYKL